MEPEEDRKRKAGAAAVLQKLDERERIKKLADGEGAVPRRSRKEDLTLNQYEQIIASEVIAPEDISVTFEGKPPCSATMELFVLLIAYRYRWTH